MTKMFSLSDRLGAWAEEQAANNNFESVDDYVESLLVREQQDQDSLAEFDRLVQEGIDSDIDDRSMSEIMEEARRAFEERQNAKL
ncbi:ribbon-helix-helix domain-containing protein [Rhizobium sp.]